MLKHPLQRSLKPPVESDRTATRAIHPIKCLRTHIAASGQFPGIRIPHVAEVDSDETRSDGFELAGFHGDREHFAGVAFSKVCQFGGVGVVDAQNGVHEEGVC